MSGLTAGFAPPLDAGKIAQRDAGERHLEETARSFQVTAVTFQVTAVPFQVTAHSMRFATRGFAAGGGFGRSTVNACSIV
jgi:hypothetical protein